MAKRTTIEWCDHTLNMWTGCSRVSRACKRCYAADISRRFKRGEWGKRGARWFPSEKYWRGPLAWNREARRQAKRHRVFCASMGDVFEGRADLNPQRARLWLLIVATPHLDWLLLTKRPENVLDMVPQAWLENWPPNVWVGTTIEDQKCADQRLPRLLSIPAAVRFVSCEPLVSPINLAPYLGEGLGKINWVIAGGESGNGSEPSDPAWFRDLRDQCVKAAVAFFFKQWGNWAPDKKSRVPATVVPPSISTKRHLAIVGQPMAGKRRQPIMSEPMKRFRSKKQAGRKLDGRTWDQFPLVCLPKGWPPHQRSVTKRAA